MISRMPRMASARMAVAWWEQWCRRSARAMLREVTKAPGAEKLGWFWRELIRWGGGTFVLFHVLHHVDSSRFEPEIKVSDQGTKWGGGGDAS